MAAAKDQTKALMRANNRCRSIKEKGEARLKKQKLRGRVREEAMVLGSIVGGMVAVAGPKIFPQAEEFLVQSLTDKIKLARHAAVAGGLIYMAYNTRDSFSRGALGASGGAMLGRTAAELSS